MAVAADGIDLSPPPPMVVTTAADSHSRSSSSSDFPPPESPSLSAAVTPDRNGQMISASNSISFSPSPSRDADAQSALSLRSEEYRQLFRLPPDEVLVQDFNCAIQESILIQGHMYLFANHICFYSNIFGFETKKIIPFQEITSVKRAKTAGIFPNAIEIFAGAKKYFFGSFLSRDEAFKLINDGWLQRDNGVKEITEHQESISGFISRENEILIEKVDSFKQVNELDSNDRNKDAVSSDDSNPSTDIANGIVTVTQPQQIVEQDVRPVGSTWTLSSTKTRIWNMENLDAPEIPKSYTRVAETKFPIKVEEFFNLFFSDDAIDFVESFHGRSGDKEFKCSSWKPHEKFGHARNVSFQHPIKIYFGAKFGSCREVQEFRVYRNSHLVIETSQEINDVPYGDYFRVQGLWNVVRDGDESKESCILRVYVDVAFSKKTVFKGKIVQSTVEECREAYALWTSMAHELLKQKNLEKQEECPTSNTIQNGVVLSERERNTRETSERSQKSSNHTRKPQTSGSMDVDQHVGNYVEGNFINATSIVSLLGEYMEKSFSFLRSRSQVSLILVTAFIVIFLMQVSILVLLNRTQNTHMAYPGNYYMGGMGVSAGERSAETVAWLERRVHHIKDEMFMVEARLERLQHEHTWLKAQMKDLDNYGKHK